MFLFGLREDKDVVKVYNIKVIDKTSESSVDIGLEYGRGISESHRHNNLFEVAVASVECCFSLVSFADTDLIVGIF